jgi:hypothetical protein
MEALWPFWNLLFDKFRQVPNYKVNILPGSHEVHTSELKRRNSVYGPVVARHAADVPVEVEIQIFETNLKIVFFVFCFSLRERAVITRRPSRHDRRRNDVFCDVEWRLRDDNDVDDVESCRSENESRDSNVASSHQGHPEIRKIPTWLLPQSNSFLSWRCFTNTFVLRHNLR